MSCMRKCEQNKDWQVTAKDLMDLIQPSFATIDSKDGMGAIFARTHMILLTDHRVYWRGSSTKNKQLVNFIEQPEFESCDLLAEDQQRIFQAYEADPANHRLGAKYHEDMVWSVEVLGRLTHCRKTRSTHQCISSHDRRRGIFGGVSPPQVAPSIERRGGGPSEKGESDACGSELENKWANND